MALDKEPKFKMSGGFASPKSVSLEGRLHFGWRTWARYVGRPAIALLYWFWDSRANIDVLASTRDFKGHGCGEKVTADFLRRKVYDFDDFCIEFMGRALTDHAIWMRMVNGVHSPGKYDRAWHDKFGITKEAAFTDIKISVFLPKMKEVFFQKESVSVNDLYAIYEEVMTPETKAMIAAEQKKRKETLKNNK